MKNLILIFTLISCNIFAQNNTIKAEKLFVSPLNPLKKSTLIIDRGVFKNRMYVGADSNATPEPFYITTDSRFAGKIKIGATFGTPRQFLMTQGSGGYPAWSDIDWTDIKNTPNQINSWAKMTVNGTTDFAIGNPITPVYQGITVRPFVFGAGVTRVGEYNQDGQLYGFNKIAVNTGFTNVQSSMFYPMSSKNYSFIGAGNTLFGYHKNMPTGDVTGTYSLEIAKNSSSDLSRINFSKYEASCPCNVPKWYLEHGANNDFSIKKINTNFSIDTLNSMYINSGRWNFGRSTGLNNSVFTFGGQATFTGDIFFNGNGTGLQGLLNSKLSTSTAGSTYVPFGSNLISNVLYGTGTYTATVQDINRRIIVPFGSDITAIDLSILSLGSLIVENRNSTNMFVTANNGSGGTMAFSIMPYKEVLFTATLFSPVVAQTYNFEPTLIENLIQTSTHRLVTDSEKATWDAKMPYSGGKFTNTVEFANTTSTSNYTKASFVFDGTSNMAVSSIRYVTNFGGGTIDVKPIRFTSDGYVGIGKDPTYALDVLGLANFGSGAIFGTNIRTPIVIGGTGTTSSIIYKTTTGVGATGADHVFQVGNNGATEAMRILNSGNIGIGTTSPSAPLHVQSGSAGAEVARFLNSNGFGLRVIAQTGGSGANSALNSAGGESISINPANAEAIRISVGGNVGIGTTSPSEKLSVAGTFSAANLATINSTVTQEGGELKLMHPTDYSKDWSVDVYQDRFRILNTTDGGVGADFSANGNVLLKEVTATKYKLSAYHTAPTSSTEACVTGEIRETSDYTYKCVSTNTWKRSAIYTTW